MFLHISVGSIGQLVPAATPKVIHQVRESFLSAGSFTENKGQYGTEMKGFEAMGPIRYGYEGLGMPVLITPKGMIHLHRKIEKISHEEEERLEKQGIPEEEIERKKIITDKIITGQWMGANPDAEMIADDKTTDYHVYGTQQFKAYGYKKITVKDIYPGIDLVYSFSPNKKEGFEYSFLAQPGANLGVIKLRYGGDVKSISTDARGNLIIKSDIDGISTTVPVTYYGTGLMNRTTGDVFSSYKITGNEVSFIFPQGIDSTKSVVIDPFVTGTGNLTGANAGKAKDVDFDYDGNIYVSGGGDGAVSYKLAKYNAAGVLQWTFIGALTIPAWNFGPYFGGWVVEKPSGKVYLGQGFNFATGFQVIRLSTTGLYDNFITTGNPNFRENWKMIWNCNSGSPQILVAGGGTNSNINLGVLVPPSVIPSASNITGIPSIAFQDMADMVIDPVTNSMYTTYASGSVATLNNAIYKHNQPYGAGTIAWNVPSGYPVLQEAANRPYLGVGLQDNSMNMLAVNSAYLFYWDGRNLKAFDKATGATVGTPLTVGANTVKMQGGIVADACNNVFVGEQNGIIKVYHFTGAVFDDGAATDINITGFGGNAVYDLAYNESQKLLYASGNGFVASFDVSAYCPTTVYILTVTPNCVTASATATITPAPPVGSTVTYVLYIGTTQIASNTTGVFTGLNPNITYTIVATINLACSGIQTTANFVVPGPNIAITQTNTTCGASTGTITATGSGSTGPYTYNINGGAFQPGGAFTGLAAGNYTIIVRDANGCPNDTLITILNSDGPLLTVTQTNADCGANDGTVTVGVTGGTPPYQYSINNGVTYQNGNFFTGLLAGQYTLIVRDALGCTNTTIITITSTPGPLITAIPATATCGSNNGTITAFGTGGTAPLEYSINGNIFQASNIFTNLTPGTYTVTVRDANGCTKTTTVTIGNSAAPTVTATSTPAACNNINGTITATGAGGVAPREFSINGVTFQTSNVFTGLAAGTYTITVRDATGCTNITTVIVGSTGGPTATATSVAATCNTSNGSITITGVGTAPFQYSINGTTFQVSNTFTGLAAGTYVALVRDATGCIGGVSVTVANIAGPLITATTTPSSCLVNDGTITANGTSGTPPLEYSLDGVTYVPGNVFSGLAPGIYTVYVRDGIGCVKSITVTVGNAAGLALTISSISSSCATVNGVLTVNATGGTAPLQYSLNGVVYQLSNVFSGLAPGSYTVYVRDANGCVVTRPAIVGSTVGPSLSVTTLNATCGANNAVIRVTGSGGVAPLTYSINGVIFQSSGVFLNVAPGTYTVTVKDAAGCTATQVVTITTSGAGPGITSFTVRADSAYLCNSSLGKITNPRVNGANCGTCTFSLDFGPFIPNATQLFLNVPVGVHYVTAMDASGCTRTIQVNIGIGVPSTATATVTGTTCSSTTGTITITGIGPNTPYHASITGIGGPWIDFDPSYTFTGLAPGTYTIILADDESFDAGPPIDPGGCLDTITVIVPSIGGPSISVTHVQGTCNANNGEITANATGGTLPYQYSIDGINFQPGNTFTGLASGIYMVTVMDGAGCVSVKADTLNNQSNPSLSATVVGAACGLANGTITATGSGGTAPLQYSIDGFTFQPGNIFTGLAAGTYTLYVKDANGCYRTIPIVVAAIARPLITAYSIAASCNATDGIIVATGSAGTTPYQYSINGTVFQSSNTFTGLAAGFYTITIKDDRGCLNTTGISITNLGGPTIATASAPATCGNATGTITVTSTGGTAPLEYSKDGTNFQLSNIFSGLLPGTYTITVRDANGCINTRTVLVGNINGPQTLTATVVNASCGLNNGTITAAASGGAAPLQYSINGTTFQLSTLFTAVAPGSYTLTVRDANLCLKTLTVTVANLPAPTLTASSSPASCGASDGTITATATGGTLPLVYSRNGVTFQASNIFTGLAAGPYTITVRDARNCTATFNITVGILGSPVTPTFNPVGSICSGATLSALPTTSLNGIIGTWAPALNNTNTTTYTFTPAVGQCATTTTLTITVNPNITPTFNAVPAICSGGVLSALPTTSLNGITGAWAPALDNTNTTTYTFTPTAGQCATTTTLTITVNPNVTPTFNSVAAICSGDVLNPLPTTSLNGIPGAWAPALDNTNTTTYTFTPTAGQCATSTTLTITVNPILSPTINCGVSTTSSVNFTWAAVGAATGYSVSYQINAGAPVNTGAIGNVLTYLVSGLSGGDNVTITVTPTGGAGTCFTSATANCTATACTPPTAAISYASPFCASITTPQPVTLNGTGAYTGGVFSSTAGLTINSTTGAITPSTSTPNTYTVTYTVLASGGCPGVIATTSVTINPLVTPTFNPVAPVCAGTVIAPQPTTSLNGITGTWSPALNNTTTTTYTFTPTAGQCATTTTLTIIVNPKPAPILISHN